LPTQNYKHPYSGDQNFIEEGEEEEGDQTNFDEIGNLDGVKNYSRDYYSPEPHLPGQKKASLQS
jgi:hypothetical protein